MIYVYKNVKEMSERTDLSDKEINDLREYIKRKEKAPCNALWHNKQQSLAEEILYKNTRKQEGLLP